MAEAEDHRLRASKAMTRGVFSRPDPISAANYYRRAADAYKQCGEMRLEKLHRIACGDCQRGQGAHATAASEYARAAELAEFEISESADRRRKECRRLHLDAAAMWEEMGEGGRAAESTMRAAFGMVIGTKFDSKLEDDALACVEMAIEMFLGDPLNSKRDYRTTRGSSSRYLDTDLAKRDAVAAERAALELATKNVVSDSYAHEIVIKAGNELLRRKMYEPALYAYGAATAILKHEGFATVSLYRSYVSEAVITLAMGDAVAASREYERVHLQDTGYLSSRECALEEDLVRACVGLDSEALEVARGRNGPNRTAMANLDPIVREVAMEIRVSGRANGGRGGSKRKGKGKGKEEEDKAKKSTTTTTTGAHSTPGSDEAVGAAPAALAVPPSPPPRGRDLDGAELERNIDAGFEDLDDIMDQMGLLNDDDDDDDGCDGDDDGDEIDLT